MQTQVNPHYSSAEEFGIINYGAIFLIVGFDKICIKSRWGYKFKGISVSCWIRFCPKTLIFFQLGIAIPLLSPLQLYILLQDQLPQEFLMYKCFRKAIVHLSLSCFYGCANFQQ